MLLCVIHCDLMQFLLLTLLDLVLSESFLLFLSILPQLLLMFREELLLQLRRSGR